MISHYYADTPLRRMPLTFAMIQRVYAADAAVIAAAAASLIRCRCTLFAMIFRYAAIPE